MVLPEIAKPHPLTPSVHMSRPRRKQSRRLVLSLSLIFLAFFAILLLCPIAAKADTGTNEKIKEHVIGIGMLPLNIYRVAVLPLMLITYTRRLGDDIFMRRGEAW